MTANYVLTFTFGSVSLSVAAVALLVRDLYIRRSARIRRRLGISPPAADPQLRLDWNVNLPADATGPIDRWWAQMVTQADLALEPQGLFLMAVTLGLSLGGALFVWRGSLLLAVLGILVGPLVTVGFLFYRGLRRRNALRNQLPDVMELLARSVRAGESLEQAIDMVAKTTAEPSATEFRRCSGQLALGLSFGATLDAASRRVPLMEMRILASTLKLQLDAGGDLAVTLERLAMVLRGRAQYRQRFRAATAAGRTSAILIALATAGVVIYMFTWQPDYVQEFVKSFWGQVMLATAISLQVVGVMWLFHLLTPRD